MSNNTDDAGGAAGAPETELSLLEKLNQFRKDQAKAVLKADYEAIQLQINEVEGKIGKSAVGAEHAGAVATAGKLVGTEHEGGLTTPGEAAQSASEFANFAFSLPVDPAVKEVVDVIKDLFFPKPPDPGMPALASTRKHDHVGAFRFNVQLEFGGIKAGAFRAVDGLATTVELIEYQGGTDMFARQIPGRPKIAPVVLKKGYVNTAVLWDWMQATMVGQFRFENVSVVLLDDSGQIELGRYNLLDTWPSRWSGWQLDATSSNAMVEEIELQVREIERVAG